MFKLSEDGDFKIFSKKRKIELTDLSSGEKHIITILGRATLSNMNGAVFVADEPELSLHLDWQRKILNSIKKLSPLSQIIVATHSPAIFTKGINKINLEDCK
ncbi:ATP-binding protein [Enterobacter cloacae]|nr:ATP-binding protein [Enterobacter cloacae]